MSRVEIVNQRYESSVALARRGVEIVVVGDPPGARLNGAVRRLLLEVRDDLGPWENLVGAAKALRWKRVTQPQPVKFNPAILEGAEQVSKQATRLRGSVANEAMLDELDMAAAEVARSDSRLGELLLQSIEEVGFECVVVAANKRAQACLECWLRGFDVHVLTAGELERKKTSLPQAYVVGPPRLFNSSLVTAPVTDEISFLMPAWFADRTVPTSAIARFAEGAIQVKAIVHTVGDASWAETEAEQISLDDEFLPEPIWGERRSADREPSNNETEARKILLSGNLGMWLDDGERIRGLDPVQPAGERVIYLDVTALRPGNFLLLRQGVTERGALYHAALSLLAERGAAVDATQRSWKSRLTERLSQFGYREVVRRLEEKGVKAAERARAWTEPSFIRPHSDNDLLLVLHWLGIGTQPTFGNATLLRKMLYQASAEIREELESAVSAADLSALERDGLLSLDVETEGFRGILATRVLAISPFKEIVQRHDTRVPFEDRSGQWLE